MSKDIAIKVENVSKKYCRTLRHSMFYGMLDIGKNMIGVKAATPDLRPGEFWAVKDLSFELKKGETLGIIGPNGSGKTTLLKMLNGIFWPDAGKITINGRVGALIEVGAGFHPLMTGRENIYINGAILGMSKKEIDQKFDDIVKFADIGDFLDAPVKHYSSGMYVRLGFAVAIHCQPEILLIDEILAVGDLSFQNKCFRYINHLRRKAKAIIFVGHNLEQIRSLCSIVMILDKGQLRYNGNTYQAIIKYQEMARNSRIKIVKKDGQYLGSRISSGEIEYLNSGILNEKKLVVSSVGIEQPLIQFCDFKINKDVEELYFSFGILDEQGRPCIWSMSNDNQKKRFKNIKKGRHRIIVCYKNHHLMPGNYLPNFAIRNAKTGETYEKFIPSQSFQIEGLTIERGFVNATEKWQLEKL